MPVFDGFKPMDNAEIEQKFGVFGLAVKKAKDVIEKETGSEVLPDTPQCHFVGQEIVKALSGKLQSKKTTLDLSDHTFVVFEKDGGWYLGDSQYKQFVHEYGRNNLPDIMIIRLPVNSSASESVRFFNEMAGHNIPIDLWSTYSAGIEEVSSEEINKPSYENYYARVKKEFV